MANALNSIAEDLIYFGQEVLVQLQAQLKLVPTVKRSYGGAEAAAGSKIQVPYINIAGTAAVRAVQGNVTTDDITSSFTTVTMQQIYKAVAIDNLSRTFSNVDLFAESAYRMAYMIAAKADGLVAGLWNYMPYETGPLDGTALFATTPDIDYVSTARQILTTNLAPVADEANLHIVINPKEALALRKLLSFKQVNYAGTADGRRLGSLGNLMGFNLWESTQIADATLAPTANWGTTPLVVGATLAGATSLSVDGLGTGTIQAGSTFTLGSASVASTIGTFVVTADATITSNAATLLISPALPSAVVDNAIITAVRHSAKSSMNLAYHSDAILAVARPSAPFAEGSGVTSVISTDPQTGLSVRLSHSSTLVGSPGFQENLVADLVFGTQVIRPEFIVKMTGIVS